MAEGRESVPGVSVCFSIYWSFEVGHFLSFGCAEGVSLVFFYMLLCCSVFCFCEAILEK